MCIFNRSKNQQPSIESTLVSCPFCFEQKGWTLNLLVSLTDSAVTILKKLDEIIAETYFRSILASPKSPLGILFWCWGARDGGVARDAGVGTFSIPCDPVGFPKSISGGRPPGSSGACRGWAAPLSLETAIFVLAWRTQFSLEKDLLAELRRWRVQAWPGCLNALAKVPRSD